MDTNKQTNTRDKQSVNIEEIIFLKIDYGLKEMRPKKINLGTNNILPLKRNGLNKTYYKKIRTFIFSAEIPIALKYQ